MSSRTHVHLVLLGLSVFSAACHAPRGEGASPTTVGELDRPADAPYDVEHYALDVRLDPERGAIDAACTVRLWPVGRALRRVDLDLAGLDVRGVRDGAGRALTWSRSGETLTVDCGADVPVGAFVELTIEYGGVPRRGLWFTAPRDGVPTQVYTHGECIDARGWFPCHDVPWDRATSELVVDMPRAWTSIAAGERIERVEGPASPSARASERWRMTFPHPPYLTTLVAGELAVEHDEWDGVPLLYVGPAASRAHFRTAFAETDDILAFLSKSTGVRYPYAKYAQVAVDNFPFGGMENISATTLTDTMLPDEPALADEGAEELIAHEAAHQWFGDLVTCRDWSQAWLNEGFATYFGALYVEESRGGDAFAREMRGMRDVYLARDAGANRRPVVYDRADDPIELFFTGHVYQGAAVRLHHLRSVLGDDAFFRGVRRYVGSNRGRGVTTDDVRVAMERESGQDLGWFFHQWFLAPGHPEVVSSWRHDESTHEVVLTLEQLQDGADGTPTVFRLPIDVQVHDASGSRTVRVEMTARRQEFRTPASLTPEWVLVDPRDTVPMRLDERMTMRQWRALSEAGDVAGRWRALQMAMRALAATADGAADARAEEPTPMRALADFVLRGVEDPSAEVRERAVRSLRFLLRDPREDSSRARASLARCVETDVDRRVRVAALETASLLPPDAEWWRRADELLPRAEGWTMRGAVAGLRAAAAPEKAFDFLVGELEQQRSAHGRYESHVLSLLARLDDPRARAILLTWALDASRPDAARVVAIRELVRRGADVDARDAVITLLESPRFRVARAAIDALAHLGDATSRSALEARARATTLGRERREIERALKASRPSE